MQIAFVSLLLAALTHPVFAVLYITNPTATTTAQGGQAFTINWMDNGTSPTLADIGPCEIGLYAGNMQQQTELQVIAPSLDVSKQTSQAFNINATVGPNSSAYFIRFTSLGLKDPSNPNYPYEAFSAKFALSGMSGQFSPSVQAQINGVTSASGVVSTPGAIPTAGATSAPVLSPGKMSTTTVAAATTPSSASSSAPKSTQSSGAASTMCSKSGVFSAIAVVVTLVGLML